MVQPAQRTQPARRTQPTLSLAALLGAAALAWPAASHAATLGTQLVASGLNAPLYATAPLNDGLLFVVQLGGTIRVSQAGVLSNFLSLPVATGGEQGLLGLAFDPGYGTPSSPGFGRFFVDYIEPTTRDTVVASYRSVPGNPLLADPDSRVEIIRIDQPNAFSNHKGGWLGFKPGDANNLYIATGDGGGSNDPLNNAQNKGVLLGKMLRVDINRDDFADPNINYAIPTNNPLVGVAGARGEIYAFGLRNPFRNSFDRSNGNLWIGDVGQSSREEIDFIAAASTGGQNFGWRIREGDIPTPGISDPNPGGLTGPLLAYNRSFGGSITGGYVVREAGSSLFGKYVFADYVSGRIWAIAGDGSAQTMANAMDLTAEINAGAGGTLASIASFGEGADGALYIVDLNGKVVRLISVVPEPGTWLLMLAGIGALVAARKRRNA